MQFCDQARSLGQVRPMAPMLHLACGGAKPGEAEERCGKSTLSGQWKLSDSGDDGHPIPSVQVPYPVLQKDYDVAQLNPRILLLYQPSGNPRPFFG